MHRFLLCTLLLLLVAVSRPAVYAIDNININGDETWGLSSDEGGGSSSYLGVDIADVTSERLSVLKLKEEHGAEITMVDADAPAGKAGLREHDVILTLNGTSVESAAQLRRMIKETPPGRVVTLGISRDGQPMDIKVQLADRKTSMSWMPEGHDINVHIPQISIPPIPDIDVPVSVIIAHSSLRSGLMVENITPQLGEFFGVKGGKGVLIRSVEKGSRGDKAGFRAGDVIVKVNDQPVHDTSDFTHALRGTSSNTVAITVIRDKREQNLALPLPEKKDSGELLEDSFEVPELSAEIQLAIDRAQDQVAHLGPAMMEKAQRAMQQAAEAQKRSQACLKHQQKDLEKKAEDQKKRMLEFQQKMLHEQEKLRHELDGSWAEI
jgi:serine protease Do